MGLLNHLYGFGASPAREAAASFLLVRFRFRGSGFSGLGVLVWGVVPSFCGWWLRCVGWRAGCVDVAAWSCKSSVLGLGCGI